MRPASLAQRAAAKAESGRIVIECHAAWCVGKSAGPQRNQVIAELADRCVAFPAKDSPGTWDCVRRFKKLGKPVEIVKV